MLSGNSDIRRNARCFFYFQKRPGQLAAANSAACEDFMTKLIYRGASYDGILHGVMIK